MFGNIGESRSHIIFFESHRARMQGFPFVDDIGKNFVESGDDEEVSGQNIFLNNGFFENFRKMRADIGISGAFTGKSAGIHEVFRFYADKVYPYIFPRLFGVRVVFDVFSGKKCENRIFRKGKFTVSDFIYPFSLQDAVHRIVVIRFRKDRFVRRAAFDTAFDRNEVVRLGILDVIE